MLNIFIIQTKKCLLALALLGATEIAMASFTGSREGKSKDLYSLKHFNKTFYKNMSPFSLRAGFKYKGTHVTTQQATNNAVVFNSMVRFEKGNVTYIYPYKHVVSIPKFKAPTTPPIR
ncbi:MAG: hypothetical protein JWQ96_133 [Segetibacter sp.]|nr:hypothetical protein [Segetibacter sp.]